MQTSELLKKIDSKKKSTYLLTTEPEKMNDIDMLPANSIVELNKGVLRTKGAYFL